MSRPRPVTLGNNRAVSWCKSNRGRFKLMKILPPDLLNKYKQNPLQYDEEIRKYCNLREDKYYTVSVWPENLAGQVYETNNVRVVKAKKVSKSDQK